MNSSNNVKGDNRLTDYEYAWLSKHVYTVADTTLEVGTTVKSEVSPFRCWTICFVSSPTYCGYFGAVYECQDTKQYVIVHRGTNNVVDYIEDYIGVFRNHFGSFQKSEAFRIVDLMVQKIRSTHSDYSLSFTGHSLGAFLAELSVYYSSVDLDFPNVHAVSFESPGSLQSMKSCFEKKSNSYSTTSIGMRNNFNCSNCSLVSSTSWPFSKKIPHSASNTSLQSSYSTSKDFNDIIKGLDIISYVSYPNIVNTCNEHVGTLYAINVSVQDWKRMWPQRLVSSHHIPGIVEWFKKSVNGDASCVRLLMAAWPQNYFSSEVFFKYAEFSKDGMLRVENLLDDSQFGSQGRRSSKNKMSLASLEDSSAHLEEWIQKQKKKAELKFQGNFNIVHDSMNALPLRHFSTPLQNFLKYFYQKRNYIFKKSTTQELERLKNFLKDFWKGLNMPENVREELLSFYFRRQNKLRLSVKEVVCKKCVHNFRHLVSCWLEQTGFTVDELIDIDLVEDALWNFKGLSASNITSSN